MRNILIVFAFFLLHTGNLNAQNYYVSSSASAGGNGSKLSPWNSFAPLNALLASTSGKVDSVFLKCGDTFREQLIDSLRSNLVITSYGSGNQPVISGADIVSGWNATGNYWEVSFNQSVTHFFANHQEQILARYPDEGAAYLTVDEGSSKAMLKDAALSSISSEILNQSHVCVHTAQWCWEKSAVASSNSSSLTYLKPTTQIPTSGYAYFLYDHLSYLTTGKEWKYDATAKKIYFKPASGAPSALICEASVRQYGIKLGAGVHHVSIKNIAFEKQSESGIALKNTANSNIIIQNCTFARQYHYGVEIYGKYAEISHNYFREVDGLAVFMGGSATGTKVHHNTFRNNGGFRNSGIGTEINLSAVKAAFADSCHIHHNNIDSVGYCGIAMDGRWNLIERNIIKNAMLLLNDGGALKSFGYGSLYNVFRNNFVSKSDGNTEGIPLNNVFVTPALYFDNNASYCTFQENTVYDHAKKGVFLNSGSHHNTIRGNVLYGGNFGIDFNGGMTFPTPMSGMTVTQNVIFAKTKEAYIIRMVDNTGGFKHGVIDSNYYFQAYNESKYALLAPSTDYTFTQWQSTGYDAHSKKSTVQWTYPTAFDTLLMNPSDEVLTIKLSNKEYLDLDNNIVCGSVILQPYTSKILIKTTNVCSVTGSEEGEIASKITVFPNPSQNGSNILTEKYFHDAEVVLINSTGQIVKKIHHFSGQNLFLPRENLCSGLYFLQISEKNQAAKIVKLMIED